MVSTEKTTEFPPNHESVGLIRLQQIPTYCYYKRYWNTNPALISRLEVLIEQLYQLEMSTFRQGNYTWVTSPQGKHGNKCTREKENCECVQMYLLSLECERILHQLEPPPEQEEDE